MRPLHHALRRLWQRPGVALVAVVTLALAIGANTAIFSLVEAVLLRPLPFPDPAALVQLRGFDTDEQEVGNLSPADFFDYERECRTFARMGAHGYVGSFTLADAGGDAERLGGVNVTEGFFPTLGVEAALGRVFSVADDQPGAPPTTVISDGLWRRRFGADPGVVGRTLLVNAQATSVIGVLPASYRHLEENPDRDVELFVPYAFNRTDANRGGHFIRGVGRLAEGMSIAQAAAELDTIAARLEREYPNSNHGQAVQLDLLHNAVIGSARRSLSLVASGVVLVLVIACANLANLLLASGVSRQRELAVRMAMGATRARLIRQLLGESLVLGLLGTLAGVMVALWASRAFTLAGSSLPRLADAGVNLSVVLFAAACGVTSALAFGALPAWQLSHDVLFDALKQSGRQPHGVVRRGTRHVFVATQVALAVVLLVGAALLARSLWALEGVPTGFSPAQVLAMDVSLPVATYAEGEQVPFYDRLQQHITAVPSVVAVGATNILPLSGNYDSRGVQIEDHPKPDGQGEAPQARSVTPGYFAAMGVPLLRGRWFDARDVEGAPRVVVISQAMARRYWPGEDPLGRRITFNSGIPRELQQVVGGPGSREVVGIVGDVRHLELDEHDVPTFYTPHAQQPSYHTMTLVVRSSQSATALAGAVRAALREMDATVPLYQVRTLEQVLSRAVATPRLRATLIGLFALLAALVASLGVFGVISYLVTERTHEFGVRMSLGATAADVGRLVVSDGLRAVLAGLGAGMLAAWALARMLQAFLFGVSAADPISYGAATGVLLISVVGAMLAPARRASRIQPLRALNIE
jgi:putative ABC transport system permease protein